MNIAVRIRRQLARRPWLYWLVIAALAVTAAGAARTVVQRADAERRSWGELVEVLVAGAEVAPGDVIGPLVERRGLPAAMVPPGAVQDVGADQVARQRISPGEVLTEVDVAGGGGPAALVPRGWVAVPVDEAVASGVSIGDRVVIAADGLDLGRGVVVGVAESPVVAVPEDDGPMVAAASANGSVVLLLEP